MNIKNWHPAAKLAVVCGVCLAFAALIGLVAYSMQR